MGLNYSWRRVLDQIVATSVGDASARRAVRRRLAGRSPIGRGYRRGRSRRAGTGSGGSRSGSVPTSSGSSSQRIASPVETLSTSPFEVDDRRLMTLDVRLPVSALCERGDALGSADLAARTPELSMHHLLQASYLVAASFGCRAGARRASALCAGERNSHPPTHRTRAPLDGWGSRGPADAADLAAITAHLLGTLRLCPQSSIGLMLPRRRAGRPR